MKTIISSDNIWMNLTFWSRVCRGLAILLAVSLTYQLLHGLSDLLIAETSYESHGRKAAVIPLWVQLYTLVIKLVYEVPVALIAYAISVYLDFIRGIETGGRWLERSLPNLLLLAASIHLLIVPIIIFMFYTVAERQPGSLMFFPQLALMLPSLAYAAIYFGLSDLIRRTRAVLEESKGIV